MVPLAEVSKEEFKHGEGIIITLVLRASRRKWLAKEVDSQMEFLVELSV